MLFLSGFLEKENLENDPCVLLYADGKMEVNKESTVSTLFLVKSCTLTNKQLIVNEKLYIIVLEGEIRDFGRKKMICRIL